MEHYITGRITVRELSPITVDPSTTRVEWLIADGVPPAAEVYESFVLQLAFAESPLRSTTVGGMLVATQQSLRCADGVYRPQCTDAQSKPPHDQVGDILF